MSFKKSLSKSQPLFGLIVTMGNPSIAEALSEFFDWLWIDMEHAPFSLQEVQSMAQAMNKKCASIVRIPYNSEEWVKRVLDLGVDGIIVPNVKTAAEAEKISACSLYPADGCRGIGCCRASLYGIKTDYRVQANANRLVFIQIEDKQGVANIDAIVKVPGIDGILIGPYDLSGSYGKPGQVEDSEVVAAIDKVFSVCALHKKPIGIFAKDRHAAERYIEKGFPLIAVGIDIHYLWSSAKQTVDLLRSGLKMD